MQPQPPSALAQCRLQSLREGGAGAAALTQGAAGDEVRSQGSGGTRAGQEGANFLHQNIGLQGTMVNWKMALKNGQWKITRDRQTDGAIQ